MVWRGLASAALFLRIFSASCVSSSFLFPLFPHCSSSSPSPITHHPSPITHHISVVVPKVHPSSSRATTYNNILLSICPLHTNSGCGKERRILIGPWSSAKAAPVWNYLKVFWPCAGGLSAVNAIGTQLRDPTNSGLTRWRMAVSINKWTPSRNAGGIS